MRIADLSIIPIWRRTVFGILIAAIAVSVPLVAGCAGDAGGETPARGPIESLEELLTLRYERSEDASAYAEYVAEPDVAIQLAAVASQSGTRSPLPRWESPYLAREATETANVVVVWVDSESFAPEWPVATIFEMTLAERGWVASDASAVDTVEGVPPKPE